MGFTTKGATQAAMLIANSGLEGAAIRVYVTSACCSGFQYGMKIDNRFMQGDVFFEDQGVKLVVDEQSWPLLEGSRLDYIEDVLGGGFNVENPNDGGGGEGTCGCSS